MDRVGAIRNWVALHCSPHTRGWTQNSSTLSEQEIQPVPRTRGDGPLRGISKNRTSFCSPHTRGWTGLGLLREALQEACSPHTRGWTGHAAVTGQARVACSPHTRGWTGVTECPVSPLRDCSPHTRGWT